MYVAGTLSNGARMEQRYLFRVPSAPPTGDRKRTIGSITLFVCVLFRLEFQKGFGDDEGNFLLLLILLEFMLLFLWLFLQFSEKSRTSPAF